MTDTTKTPSPAEIAANLTVPQLEALTTQARVPLAWRLRRASRRGRVSVVSDGQDGSIGRGDGESEADDEAKHAVAAERTRGEADRG